MTTRRASRVLVYGVLSLSVVSILSRIFKALTTVLLGRILGAEVYGLWGITMSSIGLFSLVGNTFGIGSAVIKFVSQYNSERRPDLVRKITIIGLGVKTLLGFTIGASAFILAPFIAENVFNHPELTTVIRISVIYYIAIDVGFVTAVLKGLKKFHIVALFTALERILFFLFTTLVLLSGLGLVGVAIGNAAAYVTLAAIAIIVVFTKYVPRSTHSSSQDNSTTLLKRMLTFGTPAAMGDLVRNFYNDFIVLYLGILPEATFVGLFGAARSGVNFLFITPMSYVSTVLFPLSSEMYSKRHKENLRRFLSLLLKYALFFTSYMAVFTWFFASGLVLVIYGSDFQNSAFYLQILMFQGIAGVWASLIGAVLLGLGHSTLTLKLNAIHAISGIVSVLLIMPILDPPARVVGTCLLLVILEFLIVLPLYMIYARKIVGDLLDLQAYAKGVLAVLLSIVAMFWIKSQLAFQLSDSIWSLIILMCIFSLGFLFFSIILCFTGGIRKSEIVSLREILSTSPLAKLLKPLTFLLGLLTKLTQH